MGLTLEVSPARTFDRAGEQVSNRWHIVRNPLSFPSRLENGVFRAPSTPNQRGRTLANQIDVTRRKDHGEALFAVGRRGNPMRLQAALVRFRRFRQIIRFQKPVTAHMPRHTVATTLLFNGCPIGHIRDILGHDRLITTCNFYLGADNRAAKKAHGDFLDSERGESSAGLLRRLCAQLRCMRRFLRTCLLGICKSPLRINCNVPVE